MPATQSILVAGWSLPLLKCTSHLHAPRKAAGDTFAWLLLTAKQALTLDAINCLMPNASNLEMTVVRTHRRN